MELKCLRAFRVYCQQERDKLARSKRELLREALGMKRTELDRTKLMEGFVAQQSTREQLQETQREDSVVRREQNDDLFIPLNNPKFLPSASAEIETGFCRCQVLRSASPWSMGFAEDVVECSIYTAYMQLIERAKHFIYIENQFFISHYAGGDCPIKNRYPPLMEENSVGLPRPYSTASSGPTPSTRSSVSIWFCLCTQVYHSGKPRCRKRRGRDGRGEQRSAAAAAAL